MPTADGKKYPFTGIEIGQHGRRLIVGAMPAMQIAELYDKKLLEVDTFSAANPNGYQRTLSPSRGRKFGRFVKDTKKGIVPSGILIYSRTKDGGIMKGDDGMFYIDQDKLSKEAEATDQKGKTVLFIADGQHRTFGYSEAFKAGWLTQSSKYDVPFTMLFYDDKEAPFSNSKLEEANQFYVLNTTQKRMDTALAHEFLFKQHQDLEGLIGEGTRIPEESKKADFTPYKVYIAKHLLDDSDSPLKGRIKIPAADANPDAVISENSFTRSIDPVMAYAKDANLTVGQIVTLLKNYWGALAELCPEAGEFDPENYLLLRTPGVYSLHMLLPKLIARKRSLGDVPTKDQFKSVLEPIDEVFTDRFWATDKGVTNELEAFAGQFGTGGKAFDQLKNHILSQMDGA